MDVSLTPESALLLAIERIGSQAGLARLCGISQPAVHKWVRNRAQLPAEHVLTVEAATGVPRWQLRPDLYPPHEFAGSPDPESFRGSGGAPAGGCPVPPAGQCSHQSSGTRPGEASAEVGGATSADARSSRPRKCA